MTLERLRVLAWVPQPLDTSPGQRFRIEQWAPHLRSSGVEITWSPFADVSLTATLHRPGLLFPKAAGLTRALTRRIREARAAGGFDVVYVFREGALLGPAVAERILVRQRVPYVFDFDDAIWVRYVSPANKYFSYLRFPGKTAGLCRRASAVMAGNAFLESYARRYNGNVHVVPTTIDTGKYPCLPPRSPDVPVIGWTGSYSSEQYLAILAPVLERLARRHRFRVVVVGGGRFTASGVEVEHRPWRAESEVTDLSDFDVGVMPLEDTVWERGKCGLKALQYLALGVPAVVSPVGVNEQIVQDGRNGFLAPDEAAWERALGLLLEDGGLRARLGAAGRALVEQRYSASVHAPRVEQLLRQVAR